MSEMIKRVAQALKDAGLREDYDVRLALARAAIQAAREPTEAMLDASKHAEIKKSVRFSDRSIYQAMIDEALK